MKLFKSILLAALIVFMSSSFTSAQFSSAGVKGGLNLSKLDYENDLQGYDFSSREGLNIGLFGNYNLTHNLIIHGEAIYSMRGTEYGVEEKILGGMRIPPHKFIQKWDYLEIPILLQYNFSIESNLTPKVFLGSVASLLLNAKIEAINDGESMGDIDQKDQVKSTEFGIVFGIGADINLAAGNIIFDIRYHKGITNVNNDDQGSTIKSSTISFNIGYGFNL